MTKNTEAGEASRAAAKEAFAAAAESFERSDTDGFVSQWASNMTGHQALLQARIDENGGTWNYPALFDLDGNLVAAKLVDGRFGYSWGLLESDDPHSPFVAWVNTSSSFKAKTQSEYMRRKGYTVGTVAAPATADLGGGGTGLAGAMNVSAYARRTDGGFSRDVQIVDVDGWYARFDD